MNKTIFIVRHGHAEFDAKTDFERKLSQKGILAINKTAEFITKQSKQFNSTPQLCISSAAMRTKQTAQIICKKINSVKIEYDKMLYSTSPSTWLNKISTSNEQNILIIGHNPTFSQLINNFCGENIHMQPANCAIIKLEIKPDGIVYPAQLVHYFSKN